ncbi:CCA tRNA nucleotidyltransferase [Oscillospiraceae bacterium WX1]
MTEIPGFVRRILIALETGGFSACLVGGCLRDMLMKRPVHDWDVATSARAEQIAALFPKTVNTGIRFGTVTVLTDHGPVEVTTFRSDGDYRDNRHPESVRFVGDLYEDLKRRDFTMNAIAMTAGGVRSDPFDGQGDIEKGLIRCVGDPEARFGEDALRLFRAVRFAAQLGFDIEAETRAAIIKCAPLCAALSAERVRDETEKILMSDNPALVGTAIVFGLYVSRLKAAKSVPENLERIKKLPKNARMRWSAFCAVLCRDRLIDDAGDFLRAMRLDAKTIKAGGAGVKTALTGHIGDAVAIKRVLSGIGEDGALCTAAAEEVLYGTDAVSRVEEVLSSGACWSYKDLAVSGDDLLRLGFDADKRLGCILHKLLQHVIENPRDNRKDILKKIAENER